MQARLESDRVPAFEFEQRTHPALARAQALETLADPMLEPSVWALITSLFGSVLSMGLLARAFPPYAAFLVLGCAAFMAMVIAASLAAQTRRLRQRVDALQTLVRHLDERR